MILRWTPRSYAGFAPYQQAVFGRTWMSNLAAFVAPAPAASTTHWMLLLGVGR